MSEFDFDLNEALKYISPSDLSYQEWVNVGMALKEEGYSVTVWDNWSANDNRYHKGECEKKWESFNGSSSPVTGATIVQMAKDRGMMSAREKTESLTGTMKYHTNITMNTLL